MPIIHSIRILYADIYCVAQKLSKRDKLGIQSVIEKLTLEIFSLAIEAAFKSKNQKMVPLETLRVKIEILKHLIRTEYELKIINEKVYLRMSEQLVEISKMTNGWLGFVTQKSPQSESS